MTATRAQDPTPPAAARVPGAAGAAVAGLTIDGVSLTFRGTRTVHVLDHVSLDVAAGEVVALIGPNGCGKSTLLRVLSGLIQADAGSVSVGTAPVTAPDPRVGLVFQEPRLLAWRSAQDNVCFPMELEGWPKDRQAARAEALLGLVGLREFALAKPSTLSGGTRQRVAIARALALEPQVLLLDEPFSALDALTRERFNAELLRLWERTGTTIVIVTHSIPEAIFLADRVIVMSPRPGSVVADVRVELRRPRRVVDMDSALVSSLAADIRAQLVDTTDDRIAMVEDHVQVVALAGSKGARRHADTDPGAPAWFDPFRPEDEG